jgi:hypothetical protein
MNLFFYLRVFGVLLAGVTLSQPVVQAATANAPIPDENLDYSINWPSGLSLGEAHWKAHNSGTAQAPVWEFGFNAEAHIPAYGLSDSYYAKASGAYCTDKLSKDEQHGSRKTDETETVDPKTLTATRTPSSGEGVSTLTVPDCVHDALSFLFFTRRELLSGRIPPSQTILFGGRYEVKLTPLGEEKIRSGDRTYDTDKYGCHVQGPSSSVDMDIYFARDAVRTPVRVRIPLAMGAFSVELEH